MLVNKAMKKITIIAIVIQIIIPCFVWAKERVNEKITSPLNTSIQTRQKSQKELDEWEKEKTLLQAKYERLKKENEQLKPQKQMLTKQQRAQDALNKELLDKKEASIRIAQEMTPFLENVYSRLNDMVKFDAPFLKNERQKRLKRLRIVLDDIEVSVAEKFRKIMEALFVEAEYGNTIEVYQEKIMLNGNQLLGNVFRLGRISLFFLKLDHSSAAYYSVSKKEWMVLDSNFASVINAAIEMGMKCRPVELLHLPVGRLAVQ